MLKEQLSRWHLKRNAVALSLHLDIPYNTLPPGEVKTLTLPFNLPLAVNCNPNSNLIIKY